MQVFRYSTHVASASCTYQTDEDFIFKGNLSTNQQGLNVFVHNCMLSARDTAINNYSSLVLTNDKTLDDVFDLRPLQQNTSRVINTRLGVSVTGKYDESTRYLYFNTERETSTLDFNIATSHQMLLLDEMADTNQSYFNVELLNEAYARICYRYKHTNFYLAVNSNEQLVFATGYTDFNDLNFNYIDETVFEYVFDESGDSLFLRKPLSGNATKFLGLSTYNDTQLSLLSAANASNYIQFNNFNFIVRADIAQVPEKLNDSWATYDTADISKLDINNSTLIENIPSTILLASQYGESNAFETPTKPIVLKSQSSQFGSFDKSSYLNRYDEYPGVIARDYTNIFAGNNQELGDDNIIINYTLFSNDYIAVPDAYSVFKTSQSLYPYTQLNINDATFSTDGSFAGDSPFTSDQIIAQKNNAQGNDGQYLCTWLSAGPNGDDNVWVDRYYVTNKISPLDAVKAVNSTYGTYADYTTQLLTSSDLNYYFFDKKSDVVFERNKEYFYHRIGNKRINQHFETLSSKLITNTLDWNTSNVQQRADEYVFDGSSFATVTNYKSANDYNGITISFGLKCADWSKLQGYQIIGNLTESGFAMIKDPVVTPLIAVQSVSAIHIFNSDLVEVAKTNIPEIPRTLVRFDALEDIAVVCDSAVYKLHADGTLYDKIELATSTSPVIDRNTEINIWFDDSGSMNETFEPLTLMRDEGLQTALLPFYNNDIATYDERVRVRKFSEYPTLSSLATERTLRVLNTFGSDSSVTRVVNLVFQDESSPYNAETTFNSNSALTDVYVSDVTDLRAALDINDVSYNGIVFQVNTGPNIYPGFGQFLTAIKEGFNNYAGASGLSDITNINYTFNVAAAAPQQYYASLIVDELNRLNLIETDTIRSLSGFTIAQDDKMIYFLQGDGTTVRALNYTTEVITTSALEAPSTSIIYGDRGLVGTQGSKALAYTTDSLLYLYNDNQLVSENYATGDKFVAFKTLSAGSTINYLRNFTVDKEDSIYLLNGDYRVIKYNAERVKQYDTSLAPYLSALGGVNIAVNACYEYQKNEYSQSCIVVSRDVNEKIHLTKIGNNGDVIKTAETDVKYFNNTIYNTTNDVYLQRKYRNRGNVLDFIVKLTNRFNNKDVIEAKISINLEEVLPGTQRFALRIDAQQGNATFFRNGKRVANANIDMGKFASQQPLVSNSISFGACQFNNGATLAQFLKQPAAFFASNATLISPRIYAGSLTDSDIRMLIMQETKIEPLRFHLPCGMRNNLDVVKRIFTFGTPGIKSNNAKIVIKNTNITNVALKESIKQLVLQEINKAIPITVNITGVEFVDYA